MEFDVTKVLTKGKKAYAYLVSSNQGVLQLDKAGMLNAVQSGHTFRNASVNVQSGSVRVSGNVLREEIQMQEVKVLNRLAAYKGSQPLVFLISENGKTRTISVQEYEELLNNYKYAVRMGGKTTFFNEFTRNIFNSVWFRGNVSRQSLDAMVACLALTWGTDAKDYMDNLGKSLKADNLNGINCYNYCYSQI